MRSAPSTTTCVSCTWNCCLARSAFAASVPLMAFPAASVTVGETAAAFAVSPSFEPNENWMLFTNGEGITSE